MKYKDGKKSPVERSHLQATSQISKKLPYFGENWGTEPLEDLCREQKQEPCDDSVWYWVGQEMERGHRLRKLDHQAQYHMQLFVIETNTLSQHAKTTVYLHKLRLLDKRGAGRT